MDGHQTDLYAGGREKGDWLAELHPGQQVRGVFAVGQVATRPTRTGNAFLSLVLRDRTGTMDAVGWEHAHLAPRLEVGRVVQASGLVDEYQGSPQIKLTELVPLEEPVDPSYFLAEGPEDRDALAARLAKVREGISAPHLQRLLEVLFEEEGFLDAYLRFPAAKLRHHAYVGGLAEHSINMAEHARYCAAYYPELDGDLLVTAALLHDIGKLEEFRMDTVIDYTDAGRLEGHIVMGDRLVRRAADAIPEFPPEQRMLLSHLILSHQGRLEHATPVTPKSLEGLVLYILDMLDSRVATWRDIRRKEGDEKRWSAFDRLDEQFWFLGGEAGEED
ncbi:MAG: HD domain-containing protein [bacterium]